MVLLLVLTHVLACCLYIAWADDVTTWHPCQCRRAAMSLEEAEAEMEKKHTSHFSGAGRLTQAIAKAEGLWPARQGFQY